MPVWTARMLRYPSAQNQGMTPKGDSKMTPTLAATGSDTMTRTASTSVSLTSLARIASRDSQKAGREYGEHDGESDEAGPGPDIQPKIVWRAYRLH